MPAPAAPRQITQSSVSFEMRLLDALVLWALAYPGNAAANAKEITYDAIVVGGGPAGLSALSGLARVRRVTPAYYRWAARVQLSHYDTVSMINGTVTKIQPGDNNTWFSVSTTYPNKKTEMLSAKKIVLATGLRDILPETPGIQEHWGKGIYSCPWCDGHEHADLPLGLLASLDKVPGLVRQMLTLNRDIVAFVNGTDTDDVRALAAKKLPKWEAYLDIHNVKVDNRTITEIERLGDGTTAHEDLAPENDCFNVKFSRGQPVTRSAFLASYDDEQRSKVGEQMGVHLYGGRLAADPTAGLETNIPGVYAIGDANSDNVTNVPHALFSGKRTAVFLHVRLERETQKEELAAVEGPNKRDVHLEVSEVWERVNGRPGDLLYAGEFEQ
ncbi:hypothetical protein ACJZ2D_010172 [Fusarium nematophilum]